ncbi:MAG: hypothetical protein KME30_15185 [Iphinoe sp. HA4291-MV1]|nr:hypothetical protein [Iphinoe sp. HA4291-MV1]
MAAASLQLQHNDEVSPPRRKHLSAVQQRQITFAAPPTSLHRPLQHGC